jgi:hypothetical protein
MLILDLLNNCKKVPPHTTQLQGDLPTPLTHYNTKQHYTTALGYINYQCTSCFYGAYTLVLRGATSLRGALEGVGPENRDFFGP